MLIMYARRRMHPPLRGPDLHLNALQRYCVFALGKKYYFTKLLKSLFLQNPPDKFQQMQLLVLYAHP